MSHTPTPITYTYRMFHLPTDDPLKLAYYAGKFSTLHLSALQTSPTAFGTTFVRESAWNATEWIGRLTRPNMHTFVAVAYDVDLPLEKQTLETGDWIGCGTLIGPTPYETYDIPEGGGPQLGPDSEEDKWHMTFVYNEPLHRRKGVSKRLIQSSLDYTEALAREQGKKSWMRIFIHPSNLVVKDLYSGLGFREAGHCTFVEAVQANGDPELLPEDGGYSDKEKYHTRLGLTMMRRSDGDTLAFN